MLSGATGEATLRVIDPPRLPIGATNGRRKLAVSVLAGVFVGTLLSILGVFALTRVGRSERPDAEGRAWASDGEGAGDPNSSDAERVAAETLRRAVAASSNPAPSLSSRAHGGGRPPGARTVTRWGLLLLVTYVGLGLSGVETRRAMRYAAWTTALVLAGVGLKMGAV